MRGLWALQLHAAVRKQKAAPHLNPLPHKAFHSSNEAYWSQFYGKSFVEIPNKRLEGEWYGSLYLMALSSSTWTI